MQGYGPRPAAALSRARDIWAMQINYATGVKYCKSISLLESGLPLR